MISVRSEVQILPGPPGSIGHELQGSPGRPAAAPHGAFSPKRGLSSVGRAVALQASGRRFDPDRLHQHLVGPSIGPEIQVLLIVVRENDDE